MEIMVEERETIIEYLFSMRMDELSFYLKNYKFEEGIYDKVRQLYLSQSDSFDRIIIFSALIQALK